MKNSNERVNGNIHVTNIEHELKKIDLEIVERTAVFCSYPLRKIRRLLYNLGSMHSISVSSTPEGADGSIKTSQTSLTEPACVTTS